MTHKILKFSHHCSHVVHIKHIVFCIYIMQFMRLISDVLQFIKKNNMSALVIHGAWSICELKIQLHRWFLACDFLKSSTNCGKKDKYLWWLTITSKLCQLATQKSLLHFINWLDNGWFWHVFHLRLLDLLRNIQLVLQNYHDHPCDCWNTKYCQCLLTISKKQWAIKMLMYCSSLFWGLQS